MQNRYPIFECNRILKKEMLGAIRDYTFAHAWLEYQEYAPGIIRGCALTGGDNEIVIGPGIIKCDASICLMMEEERIGYLPCEQMQYLKIRIGTDASSPDFIVYEAEAFLDTVEKNADNEFELCRFNLRKGARLRYQYQDLADMETEYDTVNLIHASWSGMRGMSLSPAVTNYFAETVLESTHSQPEDRAFAWLCLSQPGAMAPTVLDSYIKARLGIRTDAVLGNLDIFHAMCSIAAELCLDTKKETGNAKVRRRIFVD